MSIPPLVCSTPPPPDQCEDERDAEDFDIHYNLSQDDEDSNYNYGAYSDFIYPTTTSTNIQEKWSPDISRKAENKLPNELLKETSDSIDLPPESNSSSVNKIGFEDIVIEDLNLKVEDENDLPVNNVVSSTGDTEPVNIINEQLDTPMDIATVIGDSNAILTENLPESNDGEKEVRILEEIKTYKEEILDEPEIQENSVINKNIMDRFCLDVIESTVTGITNDIFECETDQQTVTVLDTKLEEKDENVLGTKLDEKNCISENKSDDLVDDFDDFQFISSENNPVATVEYCENPWEAEVSKDCEFGNFTANFDADENNLHTTADVIDKNEIERRQEDVPPVDETDDFGDFDDFKSSTNEHTDETIVRNEPPGVSVLNLYTPESEVQIIESINSVLCSIFTSEISALESNLEIKPESLLNETWGHLVDTDVRQPYMVNWNNSLGQKSLLKALCIDSRNILFGPKWNNGMPKYAANLTVAPLQPQKPFLTSNTMHSEDQNMDKNTNKETKTWTDPFTSDGQESCNTDSGTTPATRPTNLDVFTNVPPEMDKIYSSSLSVQPIRQINLPDTHIFTPTDSETPRSKTIHYDNGSTLVPQASQDINQTNEVKSKLKNDVEVTTVENEEDYWEFQDFKGSNNSKSTSSENPVDNKPTENTINNSTTSKTAINQLQILQPIKVEPIMPTLNWPAPGEVKETFDDFSEFVSNTPWSENTTTAIEMGSQVNSQRPDEFVSKTDTLDDDFETFQSAPTVNTTIPPSDTAYQTKNSISSHNFNNFPQNLNESNVLPIHSKTDSLNFVKPKEYVTPIKATSNSPTMKENHIKTSPVLSYGSQNINTVLQPSIASTSGTQRGHQKTGQILQPLSLESYSQINWPNPGIDLQDLSRFNPVESLQSLKNDVSAGGSSRHSSPAHKDANVTRNDIPDDDIWGDFVSSKPKQQQLQAKKLPAFPDDDEWTDFVSSPSVKPQNGLNTISLNVHTNLNMQKTASQGKFPSKNNHNIPLDIPTLNYVTPKSSNRGLYNDKHFQNL